MSSTYFVHSQSLPASRHGLCTYIEMARNISWIDPDGGEEPSETHGLLSRLRSKVWRGRSELISWYCSLQRICMQKGSRESRRYVPRPSQGWAINDWQTPRLRSGGPWGAISFSRWTTREWAKGGLNSVGVVEIMRQRMCHLDGVGR